MTWEPIKRGSFRCVRCKLCGWEGFEGDRLLREHEAVCFGRAFNRHKEQAMGYPTDEQIEKAHERAAPPSYREGVLDPSTASIETANRERADLQRTLDLIINSDRRAISMWREAARTDEERAEREAIIPDRANLVSWCLQRLDAVTAECDREHRRVAELESRQNEAQDSDAPRVRTQIHRLNVKDPDAFIAGIQRHGKAEIDTLRARVSELMRQRDAAEERYHVANEDHSEASEALAAMTIKWLKLGNEKREATLATKHPPGYRAGDVADLRIKNRKLEHELAMAVVGAEDLRAQLRIADADRVPLAQDVEILRADLKTAQESIGRMSDLCAAAQKWAASDERQTSFGYMVDEKLTEAVKAYEAARSQAANADEEIPADESLPI